MDKTNKYIQPNLKKEKTCIVNKKNRCKLYPDQGTGEQAERFKMNDSLYIEPKDDNGDTNKKKKSACFS